jgi:hypothetical protein
VARNTGSKKPKSYTSKGIARAKQIAGSDQGARASSGPSFKSGPNVISQVRVKTIGGAGATTIQGNVWMRGGNEG